MLKKNRIKRLVFGIIAVIGLLVCGAILQSLGVLEPLVPAGAVSLAGAIIPMADIGDVSDIEVSGESLGYRIRLIRLTDIDRTQKMTADESKPGAIKKIPLKEGAKIASIECHTIPEFNSKGSKGDITVSGTNTVTAVLGGFREEVLRFVEQYVGAKFLLIIEECGPEDLSYLVGTFCKPMVLKEYDIRNNKDSRSGTITFENSSIYQPVRYTGGENNGG